jgi:2-haloalkanoic acid dehalogenase type II
MLDTSRIRAITLDLDDTLWPIMPTIRQAEHSLQAWLEQHAPATARYLSDPQVRHTVRAQVSQDSAHMAHDLSWQRREAIRRALQQAGDHEALAEPAFEVFFAARQQVSFFDDALPALQALARRFPLVAVSNGNADVHRVGIGGFFHGKVSAREVGVGKPHPRIFEAAARCAGVDASAVLHIGDDPLLDVVGAHAVGMQTVWVNRDQSSWSHAQAQPHLTVAHLHALCEHLSPVLLDPSRG